LSIEVVFAVTVVLALAVREDCLPIQRSNFKAYLVPTINWI